MSLKTIRNLLQREVVIVDYGDVKLSYLMDGNNPVDFKVFEELEKLNIEAINEVGCDEYFKMESVVKTVATPAPVKPIPVVQPPKQPPVQPPVQP